MTPPRTKYAKLGRFLATQPPETMNLSLSLAEIVRILGGPLPASAYGRSWWANSPHLTQAREWLQAGWRVQRTALRHDVPSVLFARTGTAADDSRSAQTERAARVRRLGPSRAPKPRPRR